MQLTVYTTEEIAKFLAKKRAEGYSRSGFVRFLILREMKKEEQNMQEVLDNGN